MKNKKVIIIAATSVTVLVILYLAFKKAGGKDENTQQLRADYEALMKKIDNAKT
jgi:hypothetical protein